MATLSLPTPKDGGKTPRERAEIELTGLKAARKPFEKDWEEIAELALPYRYPYTRSNSSGIGSTATAQRRSNARLSDTRPRRAARVLTAGLHSGLSSQVVPWFELSTFDTDLASFHTSRVWLAEATKTIYAMLSGTNFYEASKMGYAEVGCFGLDSCIMLEHDEYMAVCHPLTAGECWIGEDDGLRADRIFRTANISVGNMVRMFPWDKLSRPVREAYDKSNHHLKVQCVHGIYRNSDYRGLADAANKPWKSIWWEVNNPDKKSLLRESGYDSKPFWAARWETHGGDVYSQSAPGFDALPDMRSLQLAGRRRAQGRDLLVRPPLKVPTGLRRGRVTVEPGALLYGSAVDLEQLGPLINPDYRMVQALREDQYEFRKDVDECFYVDLFQAISSMDGVQPRNDLEMQLRDNEKLTQLGPVIDRLNVEKLEVAVARAFDIAQRRQMLRPRPPELEGKALQIKFVSILAQAQRAAANTAIERAARFVGFLAAQFPEAAMKFDAAAAVDEFALATGAPPRIIRSDEIVQKLQQEQAQQVQAAQMAQMAPAMRDGAQAAELLSRTDTGDGSMLNQILGA